MPIVRSLSSSLSLAFPKFKPSSLPLSEFTPSSLVCPGSRLSIQTSTGDSRQSKPIPDIPSRLPIRPQNLLHSSEPAPPLQPKSPKSKSKSARRKEKCRGIPRSKPIPVRPKVLLTHKINSNDQVYILHLDSITPLPEYLSNLAASQEQQQLEIPEEYRDLAEVFSKAKAHELPPHRGHLDHHIPLEEGAKPVFGPIYNLSETELQVLKDYIDENLHKRFIRPSTSPFGSPVLFVKKADGSLRLCVDYRVLNRITIKNRYPIPLISELIDRFKSKKCFTRLDVRDAFNRLWVAEGDEYKTAFHTRYGHFEYLVMPFGLTGAPGSFQSYINEILRPYLDIFCVVYLDDILIYSDTMEEHVRQVRLILKALQEHGLYVKLEKCEFHVETINFLGFVITPNGIHMDPDRIATITEWPVPRSVTEIQIFLGFANFYRRFIQYPPHEMDQNQKSPSSISLSSSTTNNISLTQVKWKHLLDVDIEKILMVAKVALPQKTIATFIKWFRFGDDPFHVADTVDSYISSHHTDHDLFPKG